MGLFGRMSEARVGGKDPSFNPWHEYLVAIDEIVVFQSQVKKRVSYFKARCKILQSTDPARRAGSYAVHLVTLKPDDDESFPLALGDVKQIATAVYIGLARRQGDGPGDVDPDAFEESDIEALTAPDQPGKGVICGVRTSGRKTKKGAEFTDHFWQDGVDFSIAPETIQSSIAFEWGDQKAA